VPLAGDWNGDKKDTCGLYDPVARRVYLNNRVDGSVANLITYTLPVGAAAIPVVGNWGSFPQPKPQPQVSTSMLAAAVSFEQSKPRTSLSVRG
jgi:hypothetical protein